MQDFVKNDLSDWIVPVISGLVEVPEYIMIRALNQIFID